ncbi:BatD family protein [Vibrio sp. E150_011]
MNLKSLLFSLVIVFYSFVHASAFASVSVTKSNNTGTTNPVAEMSVWLGSDREEKDPTFTTNEQVVLSIEVATPRWFSGGTRIGSIEVPNLIAMQRNPMGINGTERRNGQTWSTQRWEVTLYPQASGKLVIPPIAVKVQVSTENKGSVPITFYTKPMSFDVHMPSGHLSSQQAWLSASDMTLEQHWELSNTELKAGDTITRTVTLNASDTLSILMPNLIHNVASERYQTYSKPPVLTDTHERGDYAAERIEQSTYVLQNGGEVILPPIEIKWWNTDKEVLETVMLEGKVIHVDHTFASFMSSYQQAIIRLMIALMVIIISSVFIYQRVRKNSLPEVVSMLLALKMSRFARVRLLTYRRLRNKQGKVELSLVSKEKEWLERSRKWQNGSENKRLYFRVWRKINANQTSKHNEPRTSAFGAFMAWLIPPALSFPNKPRLKDPKVGLSEDKRN